MSLIEKDFDVIRDYLQNSDFKKEEMKVLLVRLRSTHLSKFDVDQNNSQETISSEIINQFDRTVISDYELEEIKLTLKEKEKINRRNG